MAKPYVTLEQAKDMISDVRKRMKHVMQLNKTIALLSEAEISFEDEFEELKADLRANKELHRLSVELFTGLQKLVDRGCIVKDLEAGLVDFYAQFEGRDIFLCWKINEDEIEHWHEVEEGFEGRRQILELEEKKPEKV